MVPNIRFGVSFLLHLYSFTLYILAITINEVKIELQFTPRIFAVTPSPYF